MRHPAEYCSKCGGEKDVEGWCVNYCTDDDMDDDTNTTRRSERSLQISAHPVKIGEVLAQ